MPKLTFRRLIRIFATGFVGYLAILAVASLVIAVFFPHFMRSVLDLSPHEFPKLPIFFGVAGAVIAVVSLFCAWCVIRLFSKNEKRA